jgi:hypothetical protein
MYNTENQIDSKPKVLMAKSSKEQDSMKCMKAVYQQGIDCLRKKEFVEALHYLWEAIDLGYSRAIIPTILLEIGSDISKEQSRSLRDVMKLIEKGCAGGDEVATLILAHWNMNWSVRGNGIQYIDMDMSELKNRERMIAPISLDDVPDLQVLPLQLLDRLISRFTLRISTMGYLSDHVNTEYAVNLLKQLVEAEDSKALSAEKYLYYVLTDNYEIWIDTLYPWLQKENQKGNANVNRLLLRINYRYQYLSKVKKLLSWARG